MTPWAFGIVAEAARERQRKDQVERARMVANLINNAGRPLKRAVTVDDVLGIAPARKNYKWRTRAEAMAEDAERAKQAAGASNDQDNLSEQH